MIFLYIDNHPKFTKLNPKNIYSKFLWGKQEFHNQRILKSQYKYLNKKINFYETNNINSDDALLKMREENPSIVIVHGKRIIEEKLFQNICGELINISWGMSPDYRGDGITTPIFQRLEKVGFTIQK